MFIYLSICGSVCLSICICVYLSIYINIQPPPLVRRKFRNR